MLSDCRTRPVVYGMIPRYYVNSPILNRMLEINTRVHNLCRKEEAMFVDILDHFYQDRSPVGNDGLHLNRVGKAGLGRVLGEGVSKELEEHNARVQGGTLRPRKAGRSQYVG